MERRRVGSAQTRLQKPVGVSDAKGSAFYPVGTEEALGLYSGHP